MASSDIIVSPAWLWYAPVGEPNPDETSVDVGDDWGGNWEWVGLTTEPLTETDNVTTFEVDVQQLTTPVAQSITQERKTLTTTLAEQTAVLRQLLEGGNITTVAAGAGQRGYTEVASGGRTVRQQYKIGFETIHITAAGARLPLRVFYHKGTFSKGGGTSYGKGAVAGTPISIEVLADDTQAEDEKLCVWQKVTAEATS